MAFFRGTRGNDSVNGTANRDLIFTGRGRDTIEGNDGNDVIFSGHGADKVYGGAGNDFIRSGRGHDTVDGGAGNDFIITGCGRDTVDGGADNDIIVSGRGRDSVQGGAGDDVILAGRGADTINGGAGDDRLFGGHGRDVLVFELAENLGNSDIYRGGRGRDTLEIRLTDAELAIEGLLDELLAFHDLIEDQGGAAFHFATMGLNVAQIEELRILVDEVEVDIRDLIPQDPVAQDDSFDLNEDGPVLDGSVLGNDDVPEGLAGVTLVTGPAKGVLDLRGDGTFSFDPAGAFEDLAEGETATVAFTYQIRDTRGETAQAQVILTITGQNDAPVALAVAGAANEDGPGVVLAANFSDVDASDTHTFSVDTTGTRGSVTNNFDGTFLYDPNGAFEDLAQGETATDTFTYTVDDGQGGASTETVTVTITGQSDGLFTVNADTVDLRTAVETLPEEAFDGIFRNALAGDDQVTLIDGAEASAYIGQFVGQTFNGGDGNDTLRVTSDAMDVEGGNGIDTADFSLLSRGMTYDFASGVADIASVGSLNVNGVENIIGSRSNDVINHGVGANRIDGGAGNDRFLLSLGLSTLDDVFIGGTGSDRIENLSDADIVFRGFDMDGTTNGGGIEQIDLAGQSILGTEEANLFDFATMTFQQIDNTMPMIQTLDGDDVVLGTRNAGTLQSGGSAFDHTFDLGDGDDSFIGAESGSVRDHVDGGNGNDTLSGGRANDMLNGGDGQDVIDGGGGDDRLTGGAGVDTFVFADGDGADTITDYNGDILDLRGVTGIESVNDLILNHVSVSGGDLIIGTGLQISIRLEDTTLVDFQDDVLLML